jgi:hypothetical protein
MPGTHRVTFFVTPKTGQRFIGLEGAVLNGSVFVDDWTYRDGTWGTTDLSLQSVTNGRCISGEGCRYNEDVFYDEVPLPVDCA